MSKQYLGLNPSSLRKKDTGKLFRNTCIQVDLRVFMFLLQIINAVITQKAKPLIIGLSLHQLTSFSSFRIEEISRVKRCLSLSPLEMLSHAGWAIEKQSSKLRISGISIQRMLYFSESL